MAKNAVFPYTELKTEFWDLGKTVAPGTPVVGGAAGAQPGVTITGTGDYTVSTNVGPYTISGIPRGGATLGAHEASIATDGTWEFAVAGADLTTAQNTLVYITSGGALTLTVGTNKVYGKVNYPKDYVKVAGTLPVKIGVFA